MSAFPDGFLWGVSTAGHQNEGGNDRSDTWFLEHVEPTVFREPSGVACGSYERWAQDVDIVAGLGLDAYRFSVEWARVEPDPGEVRAEALDHYEAVVDRCLDRGIAPVLTFNHFTAPHWFGCAGGWLHPDAPARFAEYAALLTRRLGDRASAVVTLNEPNLPRLLTWLDLPAFVRGLERATLEAASKAAGVERYRAANVALPEELDALEDGLAAAHTAARQAIRAERSDLRVGLSVALADDVVLGDDASLRDRKRAEVYQRWLGLAREDDFVGVQNYERYVYDGNGQVPFPDDVPRNGMGSAIEPLSLAGAVRYAHDASGVPVLVTEHGLSTHDDALREAFLGPSLDALAEAVADGVPVLGYLHWTLLDNFEWVFGYSHRLGLVAVDRTTLERTPKGSARRYAELVRGYRGR